MAMWVRGGPVTLGFPARVSYLESSLQRRGHGTGVNQRRGVCVHSETQVSPPATPPSAAPPKRPGKALTALTHPPVLTPTLDVTPQQHSVPPPARSARRGAVGVAQGGHQRAGPQPPPQPPSASHSADSARDGTGQGEAQGRVLSRRLGAGVPRWSGKEDHPGPADSEAQAEGGTSAPGQSAVLSGAARAASLIPRF